MTPKESFYKDIDGFDIPDHLKKYIKTSADLYASESWGAGFRQSQEIREKTDSIFNPKN